MTTHHSRQLTIIGCGYTGLVLARLAKAKGFSVTALTRSQDRAAALRRATIAVETLDLDEEAVVPPGQVITDGADLVYLVPPARRALNDDRLSRFLKSLGAKPRGFVYVSTSGVYGDCSGALVDEEHEPRPQTDRAKRRLAAECIVQTWSAAKRVPWAILRAPGIYGPGRLGIERLRHGEPVLRLEDANPGNRIHVHDLAAVILAAVSAGPPNRIFNVSDGDHTSSTAFLLRLAELAGLPGPPLVSREAASTRISASRLSFLNESRRLDNRRMLTELGVKLKYPSFEDGIRASLSENSVGS